jgi:hypothetical protein
MATESGQCYECGSFYRLEGGRIPDHNPNRRIADDNDPDLVCPGSGQAPLPAAAADYPVGRDSDPWVYQGGAWEQGKGS